MFISEHNTNIYETNDGFNTLEVNPRLDPEKSATDGKMFNPSADRYCRVSLTALKNHQRSHSGRRPFKHCVKRTDSNSKKRKKQQFAIRQKKEILAKVCFKHAGFDVDATVEPDDVSDINALVNDPKTLTDYEKISDSSNFRDYVEVDKDCQVAEFLTTKEIVELVKGGDTDDITAENNDKHPQKTKPPPSELEARQASSLLFSYFQSNCHIDEYEMVMQQVNKLLDDCHTKSNHHY